MATFSNRATLTYNGTETNSNVVTGEVLDVLTLSKTALTPTYGRGGRVTFLVEIQNTGTSPFGALCVSDNLGTYTFEGETFLPLSYVEGSLRLFVNGVAAPTPSVTAGDSLCISDLSIPAQGNLLLIYDTLVTDYAPLSPDSTIENTVRFSGCGVGNPLLASEVITAEDGVMLTIGKSLFPASVTENGSLTYTFVIQNTGTDEATNTDNVVISDTFDPILSDVTVTLNGIPLSSPEDFTYNLLTGRFTTAEGRITVPAATYERDRETGRFILTPGVTVVQVTGVI